ncbi:hypothetical protein AX17_007230 [Amanita inopinata Kibby_2008]|nr:hypothetical protein AX17_007230 [Amanita inopinata Kibby_2008]
MFRVLLRQHLAPSIRSASFASSARAASFKDTVARMAPPESFSEKIGKPGMKNQLLFVLAGSWLAFTYAAINTNIETELWAKKLVAMSPIWSTQAITSLDMRRAQNAELIKKLRDWYAKVNSSIRDLPGLIRPWVSLAYVTAMQPYADMTEGKRLCWKICLFNAAIYGVWKFKRLHHGMMHNFTHNPLSGLSYTLLTSVFSHKSFFHLLLNCLALESFGSAAYHYLVKEQGKASPTMLESTAGYHFLGFFVSAGLFSGLVSHTVSTKLLYPKLVAQLGSPAGLARKTDTWAAAVSASAVQSKKETVKQALSSIRPSLGASGAIYSCVTMTALAFPESQVALFIPPTYPIPIQWGVGGIVALDIIGILRGWRLFDHWAHLGGAAFGVAYYHYGPTCWHWLRQTLHTDARVSQS